MQVERNASGDLIFTQEASRVKFAITNNYSVENNYPTLTNGYDLDDGNELYIEVTQAVGRGDVVYLSMSLNQLRELVAAGELIIKARKDGEWPDVV